MNFYPDFADFRKLSKKGNLVVVCADLPADLETPVSCFLKIAAKEPNAFLLESAEQEEKIGRYSFIGLNPAKVLISEKDHLLITDSSGKKRTNQMVLDYMEDYLFQKKLANPNSLPGFCGGFVGFLTYENVQHFESIKLEPRKRLNVPDSIFFLAQDLIIFDHFRKKLTLAVIVDLSNKVSPKAAYAKAKAKISNYSRRLANKIKSAAAVKSRPIKSTSNLTHREFCQKVEKIKSYIRAGDCIQVVLSQRFTLSADVKNDFQIYRALRSINPSPYMFYFRSNKIRLVGSSPELLVKKTGQDAEVRPIAGTRPRGKNQAEDLQLELNLKKSKKEIAEHLMLVDLGRNDLGRICQFKSIKVKNFARTERYSHVMHLVSDVTGKLKPGKNAFDLLKATFPAGTVSGAPKIRAMQIINELETTARGSYAGCLGYFSFNQDMDMCITIRTLLLDGKNIYLQAGAGIVKDSNPNREYQESVNKAKALMRAVESQGEFACY